MITKFYRTLLLICAVYFILVAIAHQAGYKIPMLYIFYSIPSERYQDLIISFLSFGWAMLMIVGFLNKELSPGIQLPILISGAAAVLGLIRARMEIRQHGEIDYEIGFLALLLCILVAAFLLSRKRSE